MRELVDEIQRLREKTSENRRQFLRTELQTCFIAVDRGRYELSLGNTHQANKEYVIANRGVQVIERFLPQESKDTAQIEARLAELKAAIESLRLELETSVH